MDSNLGRRSQGSRCVALVGPYLSGKTTLLEAILFRTGATRRQGKISEKSTIGDASPEARGHGMSVELNVATTEYLGERYTFLDCPGSIEFNQDIGAALVGCDVAVVVCEADEKKIPALQLILKRLDEFNLPRIVFINKIDHSNTTPHTVLEFMQPASSKPLVLRQLPIWSNGIVTGFVDLALERAYVYREHAESTVVEIPAEMKPAEKNERFAMLEKLADHDDELLEQLLADMEPPRDRVFADLSRELAEGQVTPVFFGSAEHGNGIGRLLKALRHEAPTVEATAKRLGLKSGAGATAQVLKTFHTASGGKLSIARVLAGELPDGAVVYGASGQEARVAGVFSMLGATPTKVPKATLGDTVALGRLEKINTGETISTVKGATKQLAVLTPAPGVYGVAVSVTDRKDEVKLTSSIAKLIEEDPSLSLEHNANTHEMVLWGQGEMHLRVALERLQGKFGVHAKSQPRRIGYKETIKKSVQLRGRHKKQSGGHGQYGDVTVEIKPLPRGSGFVFTDTITGGVVPKQYIPAVEAGVREWMVQGPLGFSVVDFTVNLSEGSYHDVDSSEMAFKLAARLAMTEGMPQCSPVLLEPIVAVDIHVPSDATSRVNQIVTGHRGQLLGFDGREGWPGWDTVKAHLPESEIGSLIIELRSATSGVGTFVFSHDHMAELVGRSAEQVVAARKAQMAG
ncbi:MAG TPA: elongation factor G [Aestuariivirga sp.]|nr:elongation factor G [Hyphomicrobiales bacterium]HQX85110.1 elongation factor G [Aestuariivirga sp.]HQY74539.1 elongation factor G [Aestuariivirga sp.]